MLQAASKNGEEKKKTASSAVLAMASRQVRDTKTPCGFRRIFLIFFFFENIEASHTAPPRTRGGKTEGKGLLRFTAA